MSTVLHQVLLADLESLAEIWEVSNKNLGLEINTRGELVPKLIDEEDAAASLFEMKQNAEEMFPDSHVLNLVVLIHETSVGNAIVISTLDIVCSAQGREIKSHWWTFTDTYREQMH